MKRIIKALAAAALLLGCTACGSNSVSGIVNKDVIVPEDGYAEGGIGDTLRTAWFDMTVNKAELTDSYGSITPADGEALLVVNVTLTSTFDSSVLMFDTDFQAQWGSDGDDDYRFPVTFDDPSLSEANMLESEYDLDAKKSVTGDLVFSVPTGFEEYSLSFMEYFEPADGAETGNPGDLFFIYFKV